MKRERSFVNGLMRFAACARSVLRRCHRACAVWAFLLLAVFEPLSVQAESYGRQWWQAPAVKAAMRFEVGGTYCLPHYMNKDADDRFLLVNMGATDVNQPVMLYDFQRLIGLNGKTNDDQIAIAKADSTTLFRDESFSYRFKGGAVSSRINIAIPGLAGASRGLYNALLTTNMAWTTDKTAKWATNETAFCVEASSPMWADALAFSTDGRFLYSNIYGEMKNSDVIVKWAYNSLTSTNETNSLVEVKQATTGLSRLRNISVYQIGGRELIFFGEGARSETSARVCVLDVTDEDDWRQYTLIDSPELFLDDIMNVKVSGEGSGSPVLYVCTDDSRMQVFGLARDGLSLASPIPLRTFDVDELSSLRGCTHGVQHFRNFEVSRDGQYAFFLNDSYFDYYNLTLRIVHCDPNRPDDNVEMTEPVEIGFKDVWGAWSIENDVDFAFPSHLADWNDLVRFAWRARDKFVMSSEIGCMPPSDKPVIISLGAFRFNGEVLSTAGEDVPTATEFGVPVWHVRVSEDVGARTVKATVGNVEVHVSKLPSYNADKWVEAIYGTPPAWLATEELSDWYANRDRARMELFMTLVPSEYYSDYIDNLNQDDKDAEPGKLEFRGFTANASTNHLHLFNVRVPDDSLLNVLGATDLSGTNWTFCGIGSFARGRSSAGFVADAPTYFITLADGGGDTDGDGISDILETMVYGTNPYKADTSGGGVPDGEKIFRYGLNPHLRDTDGDGYADEEEIANGMNPLKQTIGADRTIRYVYDEDDRLTRTYFGKDAGQIRTTLSPAGNPIVIQKKGE